MSQLSEGDRPVLGLRERKKAKTRAAIQAHAVRLFREQGYAATTVEQVAEAAEVSTSTVFRYFPTKEDLVVHDDYDPMLLAAFRAQPLELSPIEALRRAIRAGIGDLPEGALAVQRERTILVMSVPDLWGASLDNLTTTLRLLSGMVAERTGRDPDDPAVRAFGGAVFGVMLEVVFRWAREPDLDMLAEIDDSLVRLEAGLPL